MNDPAEQAVTDATLEYQLTHYLTQRLAAGDYDSISDWVPDSFQGKIAADISHRNRTTKRLKAVVSEQEEKIVKYLRSLIEGFLLPSTEKDYLLRHEFSGRERVQYPIYSLAESNECLDQFVTDRAAHYGENFRALVTDRLGEDAYADMWQAGGIDIAQSEPPVATAFRVDPISPVWKAYSESPRAYSDRAWLASVQKAKSFSVNSDPMRLPAEKGSHLDLNGNREAAFQQASDELAARKERVSAELAEKKANLAGLLASGLARYNAVEPDIEEDNSQGVIAREVYDQCRLACSDIAKLEAEKRYLLRYESLHKMQIISPLDKLITLVYESGPNKRIPVRKMGEFRDHIEFLVQNLRPYFKEVMKDLLLRSNIVNTEGESEMLSDAQKEILGFRVAEHLENKKELKSLITRLRRMNTAEAKRDMVKTQLRHVLPTLTRMQEQLAQKAVENENANIDAERVFGECMDGQGEQQMRRRNKLVELAPGQTDPNTIMNFPQLLALYEGTGVGEAHLRSLYEFGFRDKSKLLYLATHHAEAANREPFILHFLNEGAHVDSRVDDVQVLARAYDVIFRGEEGTEEQRQNWRAFALLGGAKQLFESDDNPGWLSRRVTIILNAVRELSGATLAGDYQTRDGALVESLLHCLILSVYLGVADKETIQNSPIFQKLCSIWEYLGIYIRTPQMLMGATGSVKLGELQDAILKAVLAIFKTPTYLASQAARNHILQGMPVGERISADDRVMYRVEVNSCTARAGVRAVAVAQGRLLIRNGVPLPVVRQVISLMPGGGQQGVFFEILNREAAAPHPVIGPAVVGVFANPAAGNPNPVVDNPLAL